LYQFYFYSISCLLCIFLNKPEKSPLRRRDSSPPSANPFSCGSTKSMGKITIEARTLPAQLKAVSGNLFWLGHHPKRLRLHAAAPARTFAQQQLAF
jgi:hypothetical protein